MFSDFIKAISHRRCERMFISHITVCWSVGVFSKFSGFIKAIFHRRCERMFISHITVCWSVGVFSKGLQVDKLPKV